MNNDRSNEVMQYDEVISKAEFDSAYQELMRVWDAPITEVQTDNDKKAFDCNLDIVTRYQAQHILKQDFNGQ